MSKKLFYGGFWAGSASLSVYFFILTSHGATYHNFKIVNKVGFKLFLNIFSLVYVYSRRKLQLSDTCASIKKFTNYKYCIMCVTTPRKSWG